jgi:hypothetical protein
MDIDVAIAATSTSPPNRQPFCFVSSRLHSTGRPTRYSCQDHFPCGCNLSTSNGHTRHRPARLGSKVEADRCSSFPILIGRFRVTFHALDPCSSMPTTATLLRRTLETLTYSWVVDGAGNVNRKSVLNWKNSKVSSRSWGIGTVRHTSHVSDAQWCWIVCCVVIAETNTHR